jgi:DNA-binding PadR family transcriptional regulator
VVKIEQLATEVAGGGVAGGIKLTPVSYVVLGLIGLRGPSTPYDLKRAVGHSVGHVWPFPHSQLYAEPVRLTEAGLLREEREEGGRNRRTYSITAEGLAALRRWLETPSRETYEFRDLAQLQLFFSEFGTRESVVALATFQVELHRRRLAEYEEIVARFGNRPELAFRLEP